MNKRQRKKRATLAARRYQERFNPRMPSQSGTVKKLRISGPDWLWREMRDHPEYFTAADPGEWPRKPDVWKERMEVDYRAAPIAFRSGPVDPERLRVFHFTALRRPERSAEADPVGE